MIWKNTDDRYGAVHKTLHWIIAIMVLMMLVMGLVMGDIPNGPDKFWVYGIHKSLGITILFLMLCRLGWKIANWHRPQSLPTHKPWERLLAGAVHWGLYALLLAMPLSGWLGTAAANSTINWFGFFVVPNPIAPNPDLREIFFGAHNIIAWGIGGLIALHIAGAVKHTVIDRDDTLRRMVPFATLLLLLVPALAMADKPAPVWTIDQAKSTLTISATQEGGAFKASFKNFSGTITLDPAKPETGTGKIMIDLSSFDSENAERDSTVQQKEWFNAQDFPTAVYTITSFSHGESTEQEAGNFIAHGKLTLRGITLPLDIPFALEWEHDKDARLLKSHAVGQASLKRLDFDVGNGSWKDESMVGNAVTVKIDVVATAKAE